MRKIIFLFLISILSLSAVDISLTQTPENNNTQIVPKKYRVFGENLFLGKFKNINQLIYNPNYRINRGDTIQIVFWGAYNEEIKVVVDSQGNIFIPKVGVIHVLGVKAAYLNNIIQNAVKKVFKNNVFVYANVLNFQPINVFVAGSVNKPGLYQGLGSDSIIQYLDKAGGINLNDGSFRIIDIKRDNKVLKTIDLYSFLLTGKLNLFQFKNGDVIYVHPIKYYFFVKGDAKRAYRFEMLKPVISMKEVKKLALPNENATLIIVNHWKENGELITKRLKINNDKFLVQNGDEVEFVSDYNAMQIHINVEGEVLGKHNYIVEKGTTLAEFLKEMRYSPLANKQAVQLYRKSIAKLQKQLIEAQLKDLEARVLTASSVTTGGATIRKEEAKLILDFIKRAREVQPKGRVVLNEDSNLSKIVLEEGDVIYIPKKSHIVTIQGEVKIPGAQSYVEGLKADDYIKSVGGFTDRADKENVLIIRQNGKVITYDADSIFAKSPVIKPGDSILVLGKPSSENLQISKDITQILYQIAVSAGIVLRLF